MSYISHIGYKCQIIYISYMSYISHIGYICQVI